MLKKINLLYLVVALALLFVLYNILTTPKEIDVTLKVWRDYSVTIVVYPDPDYVANIFSVQLRDTRLDPCSPDWSDLVYAAIKGHKNTNPGDFRSEILPDKDWFNDPQHVQYTQESTYIAGLYMPAKGQLYKLVPASAEKPNADSIQVDGKTYYELPTYCGDTECNYGEEVPFVQEDTQNGLLYKYGGKYFVFSLPDDFFKISQDATATTLHLTSK
jgi:hypothetical protein